MKRFVFTALLVMIFTPAPSFGYEIIDTHGGSYGQTPWVLQYSPGTAPSYTLDQENELLGVYGDFTEEGNQIWINNTEPGEKNNTLYTIEVTEFVQQYDVSDWSYNFSDVNYELDLPSLEPVTQTFTVKPDEQISFESVFTFDYLTPHLSFNDYPTPMDPTDYAFFVIDVGFSTTYSVEITSVKPVPEPATMLLFGTGLISVFGSRLRRKK